MALKDLLSISEDQVRDIEISEDLLRKDLDEYRKLIAY